MKKRITLGGSEIEYTLERKRVKNLNLRIQKDGSVYVSAGKTVPLAQIEAFLKLKESFILRAIQSCTQSGSRKMEFYDGEKFYYLGAEHILNIKSGTKNEYELFCGKLILRSKDTDNFESLRKLFLTFERQSAERIITEICERVYPEYKDSVRSFPEIHFRRMKTCWGTCTPKKNKLTFNIQLIEKPIECIEYVVYHEFTHFIHANHSKDFYNELKSHVFDFKERKKLLNNGILNSI